MKKLIFLPVFMMLFASIHSDNRGTSYNRNQYQSRNYIAHETPNDESVKIYPVDRGSTTDSSDYGEEDRQYQSRGYPDPNQPHQHTQPEEQNNGENNNPQQGADDQVQFEQANYYYGQYRQQPSNQSYQNNYKR